MRFLKKSRTFTRGIALITVLALVLTTFQITVLAGTTVEFSITASTDAVVVGDTFSVDLNITALPDTLHASGLKSASLQLTYDPEVLKITGTAAGSTSIVPEASSNLVSSAIYDTYGFEPSSFNHTLGIDNIIYAATSNGIKTTGVIFTLTFEVLSLPEAGNTTVSLANKPSSSNPRDFTPTTFSPDFTAASDNITITVMPPAAPVITTTAQTVNSDTIAVSGTTEAATTVEIFVDGVSKGGATVTDTAFTKSVTLNANAANVITAKSAKVGSPASNASNSVTITHDSISPIVTGISNNAKYKTNVTVTIADGSATLSMDSGQVVSFTSGTVISAEGIYQIIATDPAGNITTVNFTIDKTVPTVTGVTNNSTIKIDPSITFEDGATATLAKDGGTANAFTSGTTVSVEGMYILTVTDAASNTSLVNFTIDKTIPAAPSIAHVLNTTNYTYTVTITYPPNVADTAVKQYSVDGGANWMTYVTPVILYETTTIMARNQDTAGNYSNVTTYEASPTELDPVQALVIHAIDLPKTSIGDDNDRTELVGYLQTDNPTNREKIATMLQMNEADATAALDAYFERSSDSQTSIKEALLLDIKTFNGTGFDTIKRRFNYEVTGDIGNDKGITFVHAILYFGSETQNFGTIGKNTGTNNSQIMFEVPEDTTLKGLISNLIDSSVPTFTANVSSTSGADTFTKLLNFTAAIVNGYSSEVASFKTYFSSTINGSIVEAPQAPQAVYTGSTGSTVTTKTTDGSLVGTTDQLTTENIGSSADNVTGSLTGSTVLTTEKLSEVLSNITNIATAAATLTDATQIADASKTMDTIMNNIETSIAGNLTSSGANELLTSATSMVNTQVGMIGNLSGAQAVNLANNTLSAMSGVLNSASGRGIPTAGVEKGMVALAEAALKQVSKHETVAQVIGGKAVVSAANVNTQALLQKADDVLVAIQSLKMTAGSVVENVEKKVIIEVPQTEGVSDLSTQLPTELFTKLSQKGIDKLSVSAGNINLDLSPNVIAGLADVDSVTVESNKLEASDDRLVGLSQEQRTLIEAGVDVYDFNFSLTKGDTITKVSDFDEPITIKLKYILKASENKDNLTVLYLADDGSVKNMIGVYNEATGEVAFKTNHFSKYMVSKLIKTFTDVTTVSWAKMYIESLASKGIINGKGSHGIFKPNDLLTRAEFVKMIVGTLGIKLSDNTFGFTDVKSGDWYYKYMVTAYENKIIFGKSTDIIDPNGNITREEMATIIARVLKNQNALDVNKYVTFADKVDISSWAISSVAATVKSGIIEGKPGNTFDPKGNATRAEAAKVIYFVMNYLIK